MARDPLNLAHSGLQYLTIDILHSKSHLQRKHFTPKNEDGFLMSLFLSYCSLFDVRKDLVLVKFYCSAAVRCSLIVFWKFPGKRLWWRSKFQFIKMDSRLWLLFISFRNTYSCIKTLNRNRFLYMITLFSAKTPKSSQICQKAVAFSYQMSLNTWAQKLFILSTEKLHVFSKRCSPQKGFVKLKRFLL